MDAKINSTALVVKDKAQALEFYTKRMDFEKRRDHTNGGYRYVTVGPKGQDLGSALGQEGSPDPTGSSSQSKSGAYPPIVMHVDDVRKTAAELMARGVQFKQEPQEYAWGYRSPSRTRTGTASRSTSSPSRAGTVEASKASKGGTNQ